MSFVNHVRMQRASQLLAVENRSIDEIARTVGYSSRSHFSRAFKDHSGLPPKDFRAEKIVHEASRTRQHTAPVDDIFLSSGMHPARRGIVP